MKCENCGADLIDDRCPNCDMNKCMDDTPWTQGESDENHDKK